MGVSVTGIEVLMAPYDSGHFGQRMGAGPRAILRGGLIDVLGGPACVTVTECHPQDAWHAELRSAFDLQRVVAQAAARAHHASRFPVLLSGNCNTMLGMVAALPGRERHVWWLDGHGDANLPDHDENGFLDGHGLAMLIGASWRGATGQLPGFTPLPGSQVSLIGARDFNPGERDRLGAHGVHIVSVNDVRTSSPWPSAPSSSDLHLHIDLDVLDPSIARANTYAPDAGLTEDELLDVFTAATRIGNLKSMSLASYDPACDPARKIVRVALSLLRHLRATRP